MGQAAYWDFVIEIARRLSEQQSFQPLPRRWVVEVVLTQWTKADVLTRKADGHHIVDFDLVARDDDTVDEQQHKLPALLEGGLRQPVLQPLPKGLQGGCDTGQLLLALRIVAQELLLISQRLHALLYPFLFTRVYCIDLICGEASQSVASLSPQRALERGERVCRDWLG